MENKILLDLLHSFAQQRTRPDKSLYMAILLRDTQEIAEKTGLPPGAIECAALEAGIVPERYCRNQKSLSTADQLRLLRSHVAIIGLGGLGGTVTEILSRIGIGRMTLVDGDCFDESNLNRQLLSSPGNIGKSKAEIAKLRVQEINPAVEVRTLPEFFKADNGQAILHGTQLAIDCLDTITDRFILEEACKKASIPLISAAIGGSSGQATVIFPEDPGLKDIYGPPGKAPNKGFEASVGTLPFGAVYMAAVECAEATTILLGNPSELRNKLFLTEVSDHTTELFSLPGSVEE
ncbi:MAG: HesA/MoeB/ThiF family protein [Desulforhopalus sp.]|nr:HesA/MoeB/ThiF family protein [Desulforhopalus sp.]